MSNPRIHIRYQRTICTKPGCHRSAFMDDDRCIDHGRTPGGALFTAWFVFCAVLSFAMLGLGAWALNALVQWVTS